MSSARTHGLGAFPCSGSLKSSRRFTKNFKMIKSRADAKNPISSEISSAASVS